MGSVFKDFQSRIKGNKYLIDIVPTGFVVHEGSVQERALRR